MTSWRLRHLIKYTIVGVAGTATVLSLSKNDYQLNSIGIVRLLRAATTVFQISYIYKMQLMSLGLDSKSEEYLKLKSLCHQQAAEKLLQLCCANKGVYIKVGQHIGSMQYILPTEYVETLKVLHSNAPSNPMKDVRKVIKEELKKDVEEIFKSIDLEPVGTASLAQVHKAVLEDGSVVAVKVQHPYVQANSKFDLKTIHALTKFVSLIFPEFQFNWLIEETRKNIPRELNFEEEAHNAEKVAELFKNYEWLHVPKVRWDLTTSRVLTMEFVEGGQINDLEYITKHKIDPFDISQKLGKLYSNMIFIHGFVHSDPHPGNILVAKCTKGNCKIILLDHGLYATLKDKFRVEYANLCLSILDRNSDAMRKHCKNLGIQGPLYILFTCMITGRTWSNIMKGVVENHHSIEDGKEIQSLMANILPQMFYVLEQVNRQMLLILKTNDLMRGIEYTLRTNARMGAFKAMSECCVKSVYSSKICNTTSPIDKFKLTITQYWTLLKLQIYYSYLTIKDISKKSGLLN